MSTNKKYYDGFFIFCSKLLESHESISVNGLSNFLEVRRTTLRHGLNRVDSVDIDNIEFDDQLLALMIKHYFSDNKEHSISDFFDDQQLASLYHMSPINYDKSESLSDQLSLEENEVVETLVEDVEELPYDERLLKQKTLKLDSDSKLQDGESISDYASRIAKQKQRAQDVNRLERGLFRKNIRQVNALEAYAENIEEVLKTHSLSTLTKKHKTGVEERVGVVQLSDLHINEVIELGHNQYNLEIAAKRLYKLVQEAKMIFKAQGITSVLVAFTGDILNSNRRADELLLNATNRANATFVAVDIIQQVILDLNQDFNVTCASVTGNESRIEKDIGWVNDVTQDNFDFMVYNMLVRLFRNSNGVNFLTPDDTYVEKVVPLFDNFNLLLMHGHNGFARDTDRKIASKVGQYAQKGVFVDYIIFGHIHSAVVGDLYGRSSGLPGSNNYSQNALDLGGKASQNIYVVTNKKDIHGFKIDLQNVDGYPAYEYNEQLDYVDSFKM